MNRKFCNQPRPIYRNLKINFLKVSKYEQYLTKKTIKINKYYKIITKFSIQFC